MTLEQLCFENKVNLNTRLESVLYMRNQGIPTFLQF